MFRLIAGFCIVVCVVCHGMQKIALAAQGKASEIISWYNTRAAMHNVNNTVLFMLSFDVPIESKFCTEINVVCIYGPNTTHAGGRNTMVRSIHYYQTNHSTKFKYWFFGDYDMVKLDHCGVPETKCKASELGAYSDVLAACCFDMALDTLLAPEVEFAVVSFVALIKWNDNAWISFAHWDCNDAALVAFHHDVVPVLLPYIELLDRKSWWGAQAFQFHAIVGCVPSYSVYNNIFTISETFGHIPYPFGRNYWHERNTVNNIYGRVGLVPDVISTAHIQLNQGNCANVNFTAYGSPYANEAYIERVNGIAPLTRWDSSGWKNSTRFLKCRHALRDRYLKFIESGDLTAIDGPLLE